ncbi:2-keto-4-pentenoate hydratase [Sinorhizobium fredii]|uniref:hydratase n=1 Tax=Rhizobium fredii TaxID=380 RepID=UPI003519A5DD
MSPDALRLQRIASLPPNCRYPRPLPRRPPCRPHSSRPKTRLRRDTRWPARPEGVGVAGRLSPIAIAASDAPPAVFHWREGLRVEAEIGVRLASSLPPRQNGYSRDAVIAAIGAVHLGVEVLDSRVAEGGKAPFLLFLADRLGNAGYALGPELPRDLLHGAEGRPLDVSLGGATLFSGEAHHPAGDVLAWLVGWANERQRAEDTLAAGGIVTTGSLCGALDVASPGRLDVKLDGRWNLSVRFE